MNKLDDSIIAGLNSVNKPLAMTETIWEAKFLPLIKQNLEIFVTTWISTVLSGKPNQEVNIVASDGTVVAKVPSITGELNKGAVGDLGAISDIIREKASINKHHGQKVAEKLIKDNIDPTNKDASNGKAWVALFDHYNIPYDKSTAPSVNTTSVVESKVEADIADWD